MSTLSSQNINNHIINHTYNYGDRQDCRVIIEVMDSGRSGIRRAGIYAIAVPYNRFSQTLRSIQRSGRKVCNVFIPQLQLSGDQAIVPAETDSQINEPINEPISCASSEKVTEAVPVAVKAIDAEVVEPPVVVLSLDDAHIVESTVSNEVEAFDSSELSETVAADSNIIEEPVIVSSADSLPIIEVSKKPNVDLVANVETTTKAKKPRTSTKSAAGGFNKPKNDKTTTKSPRKPKS